MEEHNYFTDEELELLQTALAALADKKDPLSGAFEDITSVFTKGFENFSKHSEWHGSDSSQKKKENRQHLKDDILLLQAKLVQLKRSKQQRAAGTSPQSETV